MEQWYKACLPTFRPFRPSSVTPHERGILTLKEPFWPSGRAKNCPYWVKWSKTLQNTICVSAPLILNIFTPFWAISVSTWAQCHCQWGYNGCFGVKRPIIWGVTENGLNAPKVGKHTWYHYSIFREGVWWCFDHSRAASKRLRYFFPVAIS